jgi:hypothetical protein
MNKRRPETTITFSRLNGTGVQKMVFTELKPDKTLEFEGEKYFILYKKIGKKEQYSKI